KIAAFTAQTKAIMVTIVASPAAHHGLALKRRTRIKTSTALGTAISEMRSWLGKPTIWSISAGNSGVRMPEMMPPAATIRRLLRKVSAEVIALANVQLHFVASLDADLPVLAVRKNLFDILPTVEHPHDFGPIILQSIENNLGSSRQRAQTGRISSRARPARGKSSMTATAFAISRKTLSAVTRPAA